MQLWPRVPISYNKTFLSKKHGHAQIRIMNSLLIPFPTDTDAEEDTDKES